MYSIKLNQKGLSLTEVVISLGLMGAVGLGVAMLMNQSAKKHVEMDQRMNRMTFEKSIEAHFSSDDGCATLIGKNIGDTLSIDPKKVPTRLGRIQMTDLRLTNFVQTDEAGFHGLANVRMSLSEVTASGTPLPNKNFIKEVPVAVNLTAAGGAVAGCDLSNNFTRAEIVKRVCAGTFGNDIPPNLSCADAIVEVRNRIIREICADIYGSRAALTNPFCNMNQIHSNKGCAENSVVGGFDGNGNVVCVPVRTTGAGPGPGPEPCNTWSNWAPDASNVCDNITVTQTQNCLEAGSTETRTQTVPGGRNCTPALCNTWTNWAPDASNTCTTTQVAQTRNCLDAGITETQSRSVAGGRTCAASCTWGTPWIWHQNGNTCTEYFLAVGGERTYKTLEEGEFHYGRSGYHPINRPVYGSYMVRCVGGVIVHESSECHAGLEP